MSDHDDRPDDENRRTVDRPLNAPAERPKWKPLFAVAGLVIAIAAVFVVLTLIRYLAD